MVVCPSCGQENPEGFRFCGTCGVPLAAEAPAEVRKTVTVLFCDIVGANVEPRQPTSPESDVLAQ
ncbi:MAG: zinc ribbon domain-containing protein [Actinomycetota bacterium]|nr:zinc ribbon domain-containing protein [Actinomycetota bacterium]